MTTPLTSKALVRTARVAGVLYLVIIVLGLTGEFALRGPFLAIGDAAETAAAITARPGLLRASLLADTGMILADIGLALALFRILAPVNAPVALAAMIFRLMQAGVIAASLLAIVAVTSLADRAALDGTAALTLLDVHAIGYDLGLVFFGVNTLLTAWLLRRSGLVPAWLPPLLYAAGAVYLSGSAVRLGAPEYYAFVEPAYVIALIAEVSLTVMLLRGFGRLAQTA